jgi:hypothetical protein
MGGLIELAALMARLNQKSELRRWARLRSRTARARGLG